MKTLNSYGREYLNYILSGIDQKRCYPSVLKYLDSVKTEFLETGNTTDEDLLKLKQIFYRTNNDTPPLSPAYHPFEKKIGI